ncbi:hypothetical protein CA54_19470 [Symmachiella macrocystis]|uniref:Ice-binding protein C-terminal domain-containing protein n=1 Tax=Symmachiella macrocystis TaxID=2527985 RepID=A0A5C6BP01_9PLAN|nr:PEP-CTERM sorting domain-containing protein [Symmachiella macrocystis]TWU13121.1 hypothetical protein CA54_19470 [Symmachiella macrocystis]
MIRILMLVTVVLAVCGVDARAGFIDFDSGYVDLQMIDSPIDTGDNLVTMTTYGPAANPSGLPYIAAVGLPRSAFTTSFNPDLTNDDVINGRGGSFFMTDEHVTDTGIYASNYLFEFANGITELSLDIFDFRIDGGAQGTSNAPLDSATATLTLFADQAMTNIVGMSSLTVNMQSQPIDGNWEFLQVFAAGFAVKAVLELGDLDRGVGVDNIGFVTQPPPANPVPEPSAIVLLGIGGISFALFGCLRRRHLMQRT